MKEWVTAKVIDNQRWTDGLHSLRFEAPVEDFIAGQFTQIAVEIEGERVGRPYSLVNSPQERPLEIYFNTVPEGPLSNRLARIQPGEQLWVTPKASGILTLRDIPDVESLWLLATGTALGPFLSILKTAEPWQRFRQILLVHAVRYARELNYADTIHSFRQAYPEQFRFLPIVSREHIAEAMSGRIPDRLLDGSLERRLGRSISSDTSHVMLCGNSAMIKDTCAVLEARGLRRHRRHEPGQITTEKYH